MQISRDLKSVRLGIDIRARSVVVILSLNLELITCINATSIPHGIHDDHQNYCCHLQLHYLGCFPLPTRQYHLHLAQALCHYFGHGGALEPLPRDPGLAQMKLYGD